MTTTAPTEVMWANYVPLYAAARCSRVHLRRPGAYRTLCGARIHPRSSHDFTVMIRPDDARCARCQAVLAGQA